MAAGDAKGAIVALKAALADQPDALDKRLLLAQALAADGDWGQATLELRKIQDGGHAPDQVTVLLMRGLLMTGQAKKALDEFGAKSLPQPRANAELKTLVSQAARLLGHQPEADAALAQALAADPTFAGAKIEQARLRASKGDVEPALAQLDQLLAAEPGLVDAWQTKGDVLTYAKHDSAGALAAYAQAIRVKPNQARPYSASIDLLLGQRDVPAAKLLVQSMKKALPNTYATLYAEAQVAIGEGDLKAARPLLQQLLKSYPDDPRLLTLNGSTQLESHALLVAEASLAKAVRLAPDLVVARKLLAQTHLLMGQHAAALTDLGPVLTPQTQDPVVLSLAAEAHLQAGNLDRANELFARALAISPSDVGLRTSAAMARLAKGEVESAFSDLASAAVADSSTVADMAIVSARMKRGEYDAALKAIASLKTKRADKALPFDLEGRIFLARNDRGQARKSFVRANELEPDYFPAILALAQMDVGEKNFAAAHERFAGFLKRDPRSSPAKMGLVELQIAQNVAKDEVAKALTNIINDDKAFLPARIKLVQLHIAERRPKSAIAAAQDALTVFPGSPELWELSAAAHLAAGEVQQALNALTKLAALLPNSPRPLVAMADVQMVQGNVSGALSSMRRAAEVAPNDQTVNGRLIAMSLAVKQPDKAIAYAKELQRRQPKQIGGYLFEAEIEAGRKNWSAATAALKQGIANSPDHAGTAAAKLAVGLLAQGKRSEFDGYVANWRRERPTDAQFLIGLGDLLLARGDWSTAEDLFSALVKLRPSDASALNNLAWTLLKQGKPGALAQAQRAAELAPDNGAVLDTLAQALLESGQPDKAIESAKRAVAAAPDAPGFNLTLAKAYVKASQFDNARVELEALVKLPSSRFAGATEARGLLDSLKKR